MKRRIALDIKKKILKLLIEKEMSLRELESKVNTNSKTIKTQINELEYFKLVKVIKHEKSKINGRHFTSVKLIKNNL
jgi:predicted transcriptional regulator